MPRYSTTSVLRRPGHPRGTRRVWRDKHHKWVARGDGTVIEVAYWVKHRQKPKRNHPRGPGPRPVPRPQRPPAPKPPQPFGVYSGPFGRLQATRLLNRAGFGPQPGEAERL